MVTRAYGHFLTGMIVLKLRYIFLRGGGGSVMLLNKHRNCAKKSYSTDVWLGSCFTDVNLERVVARGRSTVIIKSNYHAKSQCFKLFFFN